MRTLIAAFVLFFSVVASAQDGAGTLVISADEPTTQTAVVKVEVDMNKWGPGAVKELLGWVLTFAIPTIIGLYALYRGGQNKTAIQNTANAAKDAATQTNGVPMPNTSAETIRVLDNVGRGGTGVGDAPRPTSDFR